MNTIQSPPQSSSERSALLKLIDDESPKVWEAVAEKLSSGGKSARSALQRQAQSSDPRRRGRARSLLARMQRAQLLRRMARHVSRRDIDLEQGLLLMGNLAADSFDARPYRRVLDNLADAVAKLRAEESDPYGRAMALVRYLGTDRGFGGALEDYHHPDNIHLHRCLERRTGMPLTTCAVYLFVARRVEQPAALVPLPGHVLLRLYFGSGRSFLVDPFSGGQPRNRADCENYLRECGLEPQPEWFDDADDASMFRRHIINLANSERMRGFARRSRELHQVAALLTRIQDDSPEPALRRRS